MTAFEMRLARVLARVGRPSLSELVRDGAALDARVVLDGEPEPYPDASVPDDTLPGE